MKPHAAALAAASALALSGCVMQQDIAAKVTTADGETVELALNTPPEPPTDGVVTVETFQFGPWEMGPDKPRALVATFVVKFAPGAVPDHVTIDDVTDTPILRMFEDAHPVVRKDGLWGSLTKPFAPQDEHVNWVLTMDNSIRVYRFNIFLKDGTKHSVLKPMFAPIQLKNVAKRQLGLTS
jgi:hypothetical protein